MTTDPATNVAPRSATLNASYEGDGDETKYRFEWGLSDEYGEETAEEVDTTVGPQALSAELSGLELETTYHYRVVAENSLGTTFGDDETFTTLPAVANLVTEPPTNVARNSATLNASYEGDGDDKTTYFFEWRKDGTSYEDVTTTKNAGSPVGPTGLTDELAGLEVETTYHYRVVAENSLGHRCQREAFATAPAVKDLTRAGDQHNVYGSDSERNARSGRLSTTYYFEWGKTRDTVRPYRCRRVNRSGRPNRAPRR